MEESGKRLRSVVQTLLPLIKPGMTTKQVDEKAEDLIVKAGGKPSFKTVKGYYWTTCLPINEQVVHTPPSSRVLKENDVLTVDIGMLYKGYHTDFATTFTVNGKPDDKVKRFLDTGEQALYKAIDQARAGKRLGNISESIEKEIYAHGYHIMRQLTGHGIGKELHEDPFVLGYLDRPVEKTPVIQPGLVVAIEVIYSEGTEDLAYEGKEGWSIRSADRSLSACFEHTVAIKSNETLRLT